MQHLTFAPDRSSQPTRPPSVIMTRIITADTYYLEVLRRVKAPFIHRKTSVLLKSCWVTSVWVPRGRRCVFCVVETVGAGGEAAVHTVSRPHSLFSRGYYYLFWCASCVILDWSWGERVGPRENSLCLCQDGEKHPLENTHSYDHLRWWEQTIRKENVFCATIIAKQSSYSSQAQVNFFVFNSVYSEWNNPDSRFVWSPSVLRLPLGLPQCQARVRR